MTTSNPAAKTVRHVVHLKATVSRLGVHDGVLGANAAVTVDVASAHQPIGVAVVVHWAEPIRTCTLGHAQLPPDAKTIAIRTSRAAPLAETDVYGFESMALYDSWLRSEMASDNPSSP